MSHPRAVSYCSTSLYCNTKKNHFEFSKRNSERIQESFNGYVRTAPVAHDRKTIGNQRAREIHLGERQIVMTVLLVAIGLFGRLASST